MSDSPVCVVYWLFDRFQGDGMSPVATPVDDLFDLDLELIDETADTDAEGKTRCVSSPSCCGIRSFRAIDTD